MNGWAEWAVDFSSAAALVSRSLNVFCVTVTGDPRAQKLVFTRLCSLVASTASSPGFGRPSFSQFVSQGRWTLIVSKGRVQARVYLSGAWAPPTADEIAARHNATVVLRIQRIAFSFARS